MSGAEQKARILIVDDDKIILDSLREFLTVEGYEVRTALSANEAVKALNQSPSDLLITDVNMPGGDGFELFHFTRRKAPETVAIMMTAYGTVQSAVEAIKMGAYDYLTKPIVDDDLLLCVERALNQQRLIRENHELKFLGPAPGRRRARRGSRTPATARDRCWRCRDPRPRCGARS